MAGLFQPHATYDEEADALYVYLSDGQIAETRPLDDLRIVDWDADNQVVGIEFLEASDGVDLDDVPRRSDVEPLLSGYPFPIVV